MEFQSLLAPVTVGEFAQLHWGKTALLVRGHADRFSELDFDLQELRRELANGAPSGLVKAQLTDGSGQHREMIIRNDQVEDCFAAGMTVRVSLVDEVLPRLREHAAVLARSASAQGEFAFGCYWSPPGGGFGPHSDAHGLFVCQMEGSRRWWYSATPTDEPMDSALLHPGDLLYLPAGCRHRTEAHGGESVALTLRARETSAEHLLSRCFQARRRDEPKWARPLPIAARSEALPRSISPVVEAALRERLAAFKNFARGLSARDLLSAPSTTT